MSPRRPEPAPGDDEPGAGRALRPGWYGRHGRRGEAVDGARAAPDAIGQELSELFAALGDEGLLDEFCVPEDW